MQARLGMVCLWLVTSVAAGQNVQSSTPSAGSVQQLRYDGGAVVAQLVQQLFAMKDKLHALESNQRATMREFQAATAELNMTKTRIENQLSSLSAMRSAAMQGSSFIRWGRKSCPDNTTLVYTGVAGGKLFEETGSGSNPLCLTKSPQFDGTPTPSTYGLLFGAEYQSIPGHHDHDVPCSVCLAPLPSTIMVPATLSCPQGWTPQYSGHLVSGRSSKRSSEYVCLDGSPEDDSSGVRNDNGLLFVYVLTRCGSLPCPPYINNRVVTCVVCSK